MSTETVLFYLSLEVSCIFIISLLDFISGLIISLLVFYLIS